MDDLQPSNHLHTHKVTNQSHVIQNINLFSSDIPLQEAIGREGAGWAVEELSALGKVLGSGLSGKQETNGTASGLGASKTAGIPGNSSARKGRH